MIQNKDLSGRMVLKNHLNALLNLTRSQTLEGKAALKTRRVALKIKSDPSEATSLLTSLKEQRKYLEKKLTKKQSSSK